MERRYTAPTLSGLRVEKRGEGQIVLAGYAAVFYRADEPGTEYQIWEDMVERIMPSAFAAAISEGDDARAFWDHDTRQLLGRVGSGTVRLKTDERGLLYEIDLADTTIGRDLNVMVGRNDVPGSSFGFRCSYGAKRGRVVWTQEVRDGKAFDVREIHDLELFDVSPTPFPAYLATGSPSIRSAGKELEQLLAERDQWRASRQAAIDEIDVDCAAVLADAHVRGLL